jgi:hypothetical protein
MYTKPATLNVLYMVAAAPQGADAIILELMTPAQRYE